MKRKLKTIEEIKKAKITVTVVNPLKPELKSYGYSYFMNEEYINVGTLAAYSLDDAEEIVKKSLMRRAGKGVWYFQIFKTLKSGSIDTGEGHD